MSEVVGYGRVSTAGQSLDVQESKLRGAGCTRLFLEKVSGAASTTRPKLTEALAYVRAGDILVTSRLDRLARSVLDLANIAQLLHQKGVQLRVLDQAIDTSSAEGKLLFSLLAAFAEFELSIRRDRQADGIAKAKLKGVRWGRRPALNAEQREKIRSLREHEAFSIEQLAERFHVGSSTVYRALAESPRHTGAEALAAPEDGLQKLPLVGWRDVASLLDESSPAE